jgi:hypothetical protein
MLAAMNLGRGWGVWNNQIWQLIISECQLHGFDLD